MRAWLREAAARAQLILGIVLSLSLLGQAAPRQVPVTRHALPAAPIGRSAWRPMARRPILPAPQQLLSQAADLERASRWADALKVYRQGLGRWPQVTAFKDGSRRCETHLNLARRYDDASFRRSLATLGRDQAVALYREILQKFQTHYVDPVDFALVSRRGTDHLQIAISDPVFVQTNLAGVSAQRIAEFRNQLSTLYARPVRNPVDAEAVVRRATELAGQSLRLRAAPVVLEYVVGACAALDVHTGYLTADALNDLYSQIDGAFVGVGIEVQADGEGLRVLAVVPGSPAAEHGLSAGDHITAVNGQALRGLSTDAAAGQLKGPPGTYVKIAVRPAHGVAARTVMLPRREIVVKSIGQSRLLDPQRGIAYIQLGSFQKSTVAELDAALWRLHRQGMRSLILDLRGNPGGLLTSAVEVCDRFIQKGPIVSTRGRAPGQSWRYTAGKPGRTWRVPLVVLIDGDSASASEIVAACLGDHSRAILVGENSYGKGEVQSIYPLSTTRAGLRLTTARFYSPNGHTISKVGVSPQVTVVQRSYRGESLAGDLQLREALRVAKERLGRP